MQQDGVFSTTSKTPIVSAVLLYLFLNYTQPPLLVFLVSFNTPIAPFMPRITKPSLPTLTTPAPSPELHSTVTKTCNPSIIPSFDETTAAFTSNANFATSIVPLSILDHIPPSNAVAFNNETCQVPSSPVDQECGLPHLRDSNKPCVNKSKCVRFARQVTILRPDLLHVNPDLSPAKEDSVVPTLYHPRPTPKPKPRPWDHDPSSAPTKLTLTPDRLLKSIGFLGSPKIQKGLLAASQPTIFILYNDKNPSLDPGETASLKAASRNTTQSPLPTKIKNNFITCIHPTKTSTISSTFRLLHVQLSV